VRLQRDPLAGKPGTEGAAAALFWSPDSRSIAYWTAPGPFRLKRVEIAGGPPQTLCDTQASPATGAWSPENVVIFHNGGLMKVPSAGGECSQLTTLDSTRGDTAHRFPSFLPDARHFIYFRASSRPENNGIYVGSLDSKPDQQSTKRLLATESGATYVPSPDSKIGHLLFVREGSLMAQPFDLKTLATTAPASARSAAACSVAAVEGRHPSRGSKTASIRGRALRPQQRRRW